MSASLVAFRSADPLISAQSRARALSARATQHALDEIEARRRALTELGHQVADELAPLTPDQLRARLAELDLLDLRLAALTLDPAARGARSAATSVGEGGGPPSAAPLPLRSAPDVQP